jgi:hypothetical protein
MYRGEAHNLSLRGRNSHPRYHFHMLLANMLAQGGHLIMLRP